MGQAKNRGTFEQRQAEAVMRAEADAIAAARMRAANERQRLATIAALPPEARLRVMERNRARNLRSMSMMALLLGTALAAPTIPRPTTGDGAL